MRIFFIPYETMYHRNKNDNLNIMFLHRTGEKPQLFMRHVNVVMRKNITEDDVIISGKFVKDMSFQVLKEGDRLFIPVSANYYDYADMSFYLDMYANGDMLLPFETESNVLSIASGMESSPNVYIVSEESEHVLNRAKKVYENAVSLYSLQPAYQHIMLKSGKNIEHVSLVKLASKQSKERQETFIALFLAMSSTFRTYESIAKRILEQCEFDDGFSLLTQEEQVGAFIEFSKIIANEKEEYVTDELIEHISQSPEYQRVNEDLKRNGLGISKTQQFNVFQQVGFFSQKRKENVLYNLSDMGAGKTLMTVEAIYMLDLKQISTWKNTKEGLNADLKIQDVFLPDKHVIAPTLSVKSSWVNTFQLFYDVKKINDMAYELSVTYDGIMAKSFIYVSSFTVKDQKIFVKEKLPNAELNSYLIVDEIHQLVNRNVAKNKFFPPKTCPIDIYKIFILSGTMSNLKTAQWQNFMRFMGMNLTDSTMAEANRHAEDGLAKYKNDIVDAAKNIYSNQHRYFDAPPMNLKNYYRHEETKKYTSMERELYMRYGTQIIYPYLAPDRDVDVEKVLSKEEGNFELMTDPAEIDAINFELFYKIVGSKAITAQSMQIAEELFGEQKKQHVSDIIKTVSPLSESDIQILKVLHHIAKDHNQYKSTTIAKEINNAILNLNDGLQTKNIYDIVSKFAERNVRFFKYLAGLDVNVLEQLPQSGLIKMPKLKDTDKFKVLQDILRREKNETHLIVVNDYYALKALSEALGIEHLTKEQLKRELDYQDVLDDLFAKQSIVIVTQDMIKSSLDLVQANRLIQYQLNTEISDIIQTQNRINRIGQTRETRGYYIASDQLQENLIELFLESYRNIRVAHKGIVELFADITSQINVVNDYLEKAFMAIDQTGVDEPTEVEESKGMASEREETTDLAFKNELPNGAEIINEDGVSKAILYPQNKEIMVLLPLSSGNAFPYGKLDPKKAEAMDVRAPMQIMWDLDTDTILDV